MLTPTQKTVENYLVEGYSNKQIANRLDCTERTIKQHCGAIYSFYEVIGYREFMAMKYKTLKDKYYAESH